MLTENDLTPQQMATLTFLRCVGRKISFTERKEKYAGGDLQQAIALVPPGCEWKIENVRDGWGGHGDGPISFSPYLIWYVPKTKQDFIKELYEILEIEYKHRSFCLKQKENELKTERKLYENFMRVYRGELT